MLSRILQPLYGGNFSSDQGPDLPFVLPGELAEPASDAAELRIVQPSAYRVAADCVHFGRCGGCQYQHIAYPAQVGFKAQVLGDLLEAAKLHGLPPIHTHAAEPWAYRNRIRVRLEMQPEGLRAGYSQRGSNVFLPIRMCPIAAPLLWRGVEAIVAAAAASPQFARLLGATAEVELFTDQSESRMQAQFFLRDAEPFLADRDALANLCAGLGETLPELAGAGAQWDPELGRRTRRSWDGATWGAPGLAYQAAGRTYWVSRGAFFQVNRFLIDRLVEVVTSGEQGALAWDLFAGVGLFTRVLSGRFERVLALEAGDVAAVDLGNAGRAAKGEPAFSVVHSSTQEFLAGQVLQRERPDLVVLDPPRAGIGAAAAELLARIAAPRLVYVSCDPSTLARDLAILTRSTYRVAALDLIDLFPQTFHIETAVRLELR